MADEIKKTVDSLYGSLTRFIERSNQEDEAYSYLVNLLRSGESSLSINEKFIKKTVDMEWVAAIEKVIIPLDNIIRKPNRFIRNDEDIVPIERARGITSESIKHLAQHSDYIASVEDGMITPSKILNITKEESFETYENRFVYTLIQKTIFFIEKRFQFLKRGKNDNSALSFELNGETKMGEDSINYEIKMSFTTAASVLDDDIEKLVNQDVSQMSVMERVERVKRIIYTYAASPFIRGLSTSTPVRPPLNMTNVLKKNPNFQACVELWNFVDTYVDKGYDVESVDRMLTPTEEYLQQIYSMVGLEYVLLKENSRIGDNMITIGERKSIVQPNIINNNIEEVMEMFDLSIDQVQKVYMEQIKKKKKKEQLRLAKMRQAIKRAIDLEKINNKKDEAADKALRAEMARRAKEEEERLAKEALEEEARQLALRHRCINDLLHDGLRPQEETNEVIDDSTIEPRRKVTKANNDHKSYITPTYENKNFWDCGTYEEAEKQAEEMEEAIPFTPIVTPFKITHYGDEVENKSSLSLKDRLLSNLLDEGSDRKAEYWLSAEDVLYTLFKQEELKFTVHDEYDRQLTLSRPNQNAPKFDLKVLLLADLWERVEKDSFRKELLTSNLNPTLSMPRRK